MIIKLLMASTFAVALAGCSTMVAPGPNDVPASIATASTPADHQKIAKYFTGKAAEYDAEAARHDLMARSYTNRPKGDVGSMVSHCRNLRDQFVASAKEARALAQEHRLMAENSPR
jgi:hypothetical protein